MNVTNRLLCPAQCSVGKLVFLEIKSSVEVTLQPTAQLYALPGQESAGLTSGTERPMVISCGDLS